MKKIKRIYLPLISVFTAGLTLIFSQRPIEVSAEEISYNYSYLEESVPAPPAFLPTMIIDGDKLGIEPLNAPNDIYI